jgi:hypothetical protein
MLRDKVPHSALDRILPRKPQPAVNEFIVVDHTGLTSGSADNACTE